MIWFINILNARFANLELLMCGEQEIVDGSEISEVILSQKMKRNVASGDLKSGHRPPSYKGIE